MAKYGSFQYGTSETYGASAVTETGLVTWVLSVDWDDDGSFDGSSEANRLVFIRVKAGREHYLSEGGNGFDHMRPATASLTLDNFDRRYDPRNTSGALYPNVKRGHKVQLRLRDNDNDVFYTLFTGILDDIRPDYTRGGGDVKFECTGYLQQLNNTELTASSARINTTITGAIEALLFDVQFPGAKLLDSDTQPVPSFGPVDQKAGDVAADLADAALGTFFVDRFGRARFYSRSHSSWTEHTIDQAQMGVEIETTQPWDSQFNEIRITSHNQIYKQGAVIFYLSTPVRVESGVPVTLYPKYPPSRDVQLATIEGNSDIDGNGSDISANLATSASLGIAGGTIVVTPSATGYITNVEIRGRSFGSSPEEFSETDTTNPSSRHGLKRFKLDTPYLQDRNYASEFVGFLGSDNDFLYGERDAFIVTIKGRPDLQFGYDLLDKANTTIDYLDVDDTYYVLGYQYEGEPQDITTTLFLDKILLDNTAITAAGIETAQQQAPTGYQNPAGDPETLNSDPELPISSKVCSVYGSDTLDASLTDAYVTFDTEDSDPDGMITVPSTTITIPEDGYYYIQGTVNYKIQYVYSGVGDTTGVLGGALTISIYKNDSPHDSTFIETKDRMVAVFGGSNFWMCLSQKSNQRVWLFSAGDTLKFYYNVGVNGTPDTAFSQGYVRIYVVVGRVRGA